MQLQRSGTVSRQLGGVASGESRRQVRARLDSKCHTPRLALAGRWRIEGRTPSPSWPPVPPAGGRLTFAAAWTNGNSTTHCSSAFGSGTLFAGEKKNTKHKLTEFARIQAGFRGATGVTPNPSIERTRTGRPLQALISFWALRVLPVQAAHLKR